MLARGSIFKLLLIATLLISADFIHARHPSKHVRKDVAPYLIPPNHPVKPLLDAIFGHSRATLNLDTLTDAGFLPTKPRAFTSIIVTKHPAVPGFVFKLYLDAQRYHKNQPEHYFWMLRIQGVQKIEEIIAAYGLSNEFKCPKKWIYPLPKYPKPPSGYIQKYYILVEEDMELLPCQDNKSLWASDAITTELLDNLFLILKEAGLSDSAKPDNIPFSIDGRIAFIDTQLFGKKHVRYKKLLPFLSEANREYWKAITE